METQENNSEDVAQEILDLDQLQYQYFEHANVLCRHIISEQKSLMKHLCGTWDDLNNKRRDALVDLLFVDDNVREEYVKCTEHSDSCENITESFPTLYIDSGQKIHVDFENDVS